VNLILILSTKDFFVLTHATIFFLFTRIKKHVSLNLVMMRVYFYPPQVKQQRNKRYLWTTLCYNYSEIFVLIFHTLFYMCKGHHEGPRETTTIARQEVVHDKATCYKRQTLKRLPLIKVDEHNTLVLIAWSWCTTNGCWSLREYVKLM